MGFGAADAREEDGGAAGGERVKVFQLRCALRSLALFGSSVALRSVMSRAERSRGFVVVIIFGFIAIFVFVYVVIIAVIIIVVVVVVIVIVIVVVFVFVVVVVVFEVRRAAADRVRADARRGRRRHPGESGMTCNVMYYIVMYCTVLHCTVL